MSQLTLPGLSFQQRANRISQRASRTQHRRLPIFQPQLIADRGYTPEEGVPATRGECPTQRPCPHVRCRQHLFLETGEHRAGRPGLSSVKRDEKGLTMSQPGDAGRGRPGTTLRPAWVRVNGLEIEREVSVWLHTDDDGLHVYESRNGAFGYWLKRLHVGEAIHVIDNDSTSEWYGQPIAHATLTPQHELKFDRYPDRMFVILRRVREVSSCALDLIDRHGKLTNEQTGDAIDKHRTLVGRIVKGEDGAMRHGIEAAERMGMSAQDFLRGLRELGAG